MCARRAHMQPGKLADKKSKKQETKREREEKEKRKRREREEKRKEIKALTEKAIDKPTIKRQAICR